MVRARITFYEATVVDASNEREARKKGKNKLSVGKKVKVTVISTRKIG